MEEIKKKKGGKGRTDGGGKEFYETDPEFYQITNHEFRFGLDAAASKDNAKCEKFLTKENNAVSKDLKWHQLASGIWINPPYSRGLINEFLAKAWEESQQGATVVVLVHTCTDTKYWNDYVWNKAAEVRHIKGRLRFWLDKQGNTSDLPHSLLVYRPYYTIGITHQVSWDWKADYLKVFKQLPIRSKKTREIIKYVGANDVHLEEAA